MGSSHSNPASSSPTDPTHETSTHAESHQHPLYKAAYSQQGSTGKSTPILVLGRSGSGKTFFIETFCSKQGYITDSALIKSTTIISAKTVTVRDTILKLIDTIGFDNITVTNLEAFASLGDYLVDGRKIQTGVTGVVYIHRAGDPIESRALSQNMGVLSDVILGENALSRLTVLVLLEPGADKHASRQAVSGSKIFRPLREKGAKITAATTLDQRTIDRILQSYVSQDPVILRIQQECMRNPQTMIGKQIEERLGYSETEPTKSPVEEAERHVVPHTEQLSFLKAAIKDKESKAAEFSRIHKQTEQELATAQEELSTLHQQLHSSENAQDRLLSHIRNLEKQTENVRSLETTLEEKDLKLLEHSQAHKETQRHLASSQEEVLTLRQQFQQVQSEYASLRSQLQLQDNTEQSTIVQALKDLNRSIDDIGRLFSEYLSDNYVQRVFGKDLENVTALDACFLPELKTLFGHTKERSSIIASSTGIGMPVEDFLDYGIRALLCKYLLQSIFDPFHPAIDASQNNLIASIYKDIRQREPQAVAAKWRANCFKSVYKPKNADEISRHIDLIAANFANDLLIPMLSYFFGENTEARLQDQYLDSLVQLFRTAWEWNSMLKCEVIMLGDFYLTCYQPLVRFDPRLMSEYERDPRSPEPRHILGTLGLGLISSRAVGGERPPEVTVVFNAVVATRSLYYNLQASIDALRA